MNQTDSYKRAGGCGDWLKASEGTSDRTFMHDPWTWTTVWGTDCRSQRVGWVEGGKGENIRTSVIA